MTYSVLGIETTQVKEIDPRTGREEVFYLPKTDKQIGKEKQVRLPKLSRLLGLSVIGMQRMGKSGLFEELIIQDFKQGIGVCILDPHGELIDHVIARLPDKEKEEKVILLDLTSKDYYVGLNLFNCSDPTDDSAIMETLSQVMHVFEKSHGITPTTPLMYDLLFKIAYVLIANPGYTMVDIPFFLNNETCRKKLVQNLMHPAAASIRAFWERWDDPKQKSSLKQREDSQTILNKLNDFEHTPLRYIVGQSHSTINLQEIMDSGKILLVKLERKRKQATSLIGSIIVALTLNAADNRRTNRLFNLYADEFQNFATEDFAVLLEQSPKRGIGITMAHQNRGQLELSEEQADANLKQRTLNVGGLVVFRAPTDAYELAEQFDCTPVRTKKVLKRRTKPIFREWDEYFWDAPESEQEYNQYMEWMKQEEQAVKQAVEEIVLAEKRLLCAKALESHFHNTCDYIWYFSDWASFEKNHHLFPDYLLNPCWLEPGISENWVFRDGGYPWKDYLGWPKEKIDAIEQDLVLKKYEQEIGRFKYYYYPQWRQGKRSERHRKYVEFRYYEKREEWYSFSGAARVSGLEYILRHAASPSLIAKPDHRYKIQEIEEMFRHMVFDLVACIQELLAPWYYNALIKFVPHLTPQSVPDDNIGRMIELPALYDGGRVPEIGGRWPHPTSYPYLWMRCGRWELLNIPDSEGVMRKIEEFIKRQQARWKAEVDGWKSVSASRQESLKKLTVEAQVYKQAHYQANHHKEYLGEQPEVEEKTRISHSISHGSSETESLSWPGRNVSHGTSASHSTSYSPNDVQWYDLEDELDQTPAERRDEIANELVKLPKYTARVKLTDENDTVVEYVITTMKPGTGLYGKPLQERIDGIRDNNVRNGYVRKRETVEAEIRHRQEQYSHMPQIPGKRPPQPPENEPPITRRQQQ